MTQPPHLDLSRRERQVLEAVVRLERGTVADVTRALAGAVSRDAARAALRLLLQKQLVRYEHDGKRYVYRPAMSRRLAQRGALRHVVRTFFQGSHAGTMAALLQLGDTELPEEELDRMAAMVEEARRAGRRRP